MTINLIIGDCGGDKFRADPYNSTHYTQFLEYKLCWRYLFVATLLTRELFPVNCYLKDNIK